MIEFSDGRSHHFDGDLGSLSASVSIGFEEPGEVACVENELPLGGKAFFEPDAFVHHGREELGPSLPVVSEDLVELLNGDHPVDSSGFFVVRSSGSHLVSRPVRSD